MLKFITALCVCACVCVFFGLEVKQGHLMLCIAARWHSRQTPAESTVNKVFPQSRYPLGVLT